MRQYITRRLLEMIPVLVGVSLIIFFILQLAPGDAFTGSSDPRITPQKVAQLRHKYGLDKPKIVQYGIWAKNAIKGDLGESIHFQQPVTKVIGDYIWASFILSLFSFVLSVIIAIPIGVISATKQYSMFDYSFTVFALIGMSLPVFFFGLLLIKWFAVDIRIFPVSGMYNAGSTATGLAKFGDMMHHMVLPLIVLTMADVGSLMRYTRSSMLEVIRQDYIRTARAKGLSEKVVIYRHALKNALLPIITIFGMSLSALFGGAMISESIFLWPGIGPLQIKAVTNRDYPFLMGINMFLAILTLLGNLIADVSYAIVDPRIRLK